MMRERLRRGWRVSGVGLERLLNDLLAQEIPLTDICRVSTRCVTFYVPYAQSEQAEELIRRRGYELAALPAEGWLRRALTIRRRRFLAAFCALAVAALIVSLQFIWSVRVTGAGIYQGEVNAWLRENGIHAGILRAGLQPGALSDSLMYRLPRIAWARVSIEGTALRIDVTVGMPQPDRSAAARGDIVAACDGVIRSVEVYAGTPLVKPGQTVTAGQVLIRGEERGRLDAGHTPVRAQGKVLARCWRSAEAAVPAEEIKSIPTGRQTSAARFMTPWFSWPRDTEPSYLTWDKETQIFPVGGAWIPLWVEKTLYQEVSLEKTTRDAEPVRAEAGLLATRRLMAACDKDDEIIDEFLNFSIIEGKTILATATAELVTDIGRFSPGISD